ncbi:transposase [Bradyrhizobium sp. LB1.3]
MRERDLYFNDLRGTAATKFYIAGFNEREIAEALAWEERSVNKIIERYVDRTAAIKARIKKMEAKDCTIQQNCRQNRRANFG